MASRTKRKHSWRILAGLGTCLALLLLTGLLSQTSASAATAAPAGDGPHGFWWGTDSLPVTVPGRPPYQMPYLGGAYGGYIGMTGNWAYWLGCSGQEHFLAFSAADNAQAHTDYVTYHTGVGSGAYWFMGGPGVDPDYNGTTAEASTWGARQAARTLADIADSHTFDYRVVWMDVELPGITPAPDNGWNTVYTSACSGVAKKSGIAATVDRSVLNGFAAWVTGHSSDKVGVYSAPDIWADIFGTGQPSSLTNTYEWTYESFTSSLANPPSGWCLTGGASSTCARFFGGITGTSKYALMWQFSGGGGSSNGYGDFDQIDGTRTP